ncbi:uncharacterized protein LOC116343016 [Contarinia nasturtii]|uniref:uncharacterized protein LOC116343016 n=1 Tax=Contarinia nasturtii TaxID=265458 RepID=UPI0012D3EC70|nr:uncharacterized protein LOC116343016 [Contarinia nasturtii]
MKQMLLAFLLTLVLNNVLVKEAFGHDGDTYGTILEKFHNKSEDVDFEMELTPIFSLCDTDDASNIVNELDSLISIGKRCPIYTIKNDVDLGTFMKNRSKMMKLCHFLIPHFTFHASPLESLPHEIQDRYDTWQYEPLNKTHENKVRTNLPRLKKIHWSYVNTLTNQVRLLTGAKADFISATEAMYDGWIRKYCGRAKVRKYKELVCNCLQPQNDTLTILTNLKNLFTDYYKRRNLWALFLMEIDTQI